MCSAAANTTQNKDRVCILYINTAIHNPNNSQQLLTTLDVLNRPKSNPYQHRLPDSESSSK